MGILPKVRGENDKNNKYFELPPLTLPETNIAPENGWLEY